MMNDADLTRRLAGVLERELRKDRVVDLPAQMASEDFSLFPQNGIPSVMLMIGSVEPGVSRQISGFGLALRRRSMWRRDASRGVAVCQL
jgi:metal-dependent amidase/aminoacylase/carboxypeptidase family protein